MAPKPPNPSSKDLEDAIQNTHQLFEQALNSTHSHFIAQLGIINTKFDNQQQLMDSRDINFQKMLDERHDALTALLTAALQARPPPSDPPPLSSSSTTAIVTWVQSIPLFPSSPSPSHTHPISYLTVPPSPISSQTPIPPPHFTLANHTITFPNVTSPTAPLTIPIPTPQPYTPIPPPIIHTAPFQQTPLYPPPSPFHNVIPFGVFQPQTQAYSQFSQIPYATPTPPTPLPHTLRTPKIELSPFDGTGPLEWLFQVEQFFSFYNIPSENRLSLASFYMKGDALSWFKWMHQNHHVVPWFWT